ncbi:MAG: Trp biosynthesis-associated membrane protein [Micrococcales bacterium]
MRGHLKFFVIWSALALFGFYVAGQIWYEAAVEVGEHRNKLVTTGLDSWPFVNSIMWLSVAGILAVAFTSGLTRTILLWALTLVNSGQVVLFLLQGSFSKTPPGLNDEIEHHTGIHIDGTGLMHDGMVDTQVSIWPVLFFGALIIMLGVTLWAAIASRKWSKQDKQRRFEPGAGKRNAANGESSDPVELWDAQR